MLPPRRPSALASSSTTQSLRGRREARRGSACRAAPLAVLSSALGCQPSLDTSSTATAAPPILLTLEPSAPLDEAPAVLRAHLWTDGSALAGPAWSADVFALVEGTLSSAQLRQLADGEPSHALEERIVPTLRWQEADGHIVIAPTTELAAGEIYTVASGVHGFRTELTIRLEDERPVLQRVWPPGMAIAALDVAVWCGPSPLPPVSIEARLEPGGPSGMLRAGSSRVDASHGASASESCIWFEPDDAGPTGAPPSGAPSGEADGTGSSMVGWLAPPTVGWDGAHAVAFLEPSPIVAGEPLPVAPELACEPWEVAFGPGCAWVADDRIRVRVPSEPLLWVVAAPGRSWTEVPRPDSSFLLHPLPVASCLSVDLLVADTRGLWRRAEISLTTQAPMAHLVLNEVLANPSGPEPDQEWVELYNDGLAPASLGGWELVDGGGVTVLPDAVLAPRSFALVVNESFDPAGEFDPVPPADTLLIRVPRLGQNGLSNDGEPLTLRDAGRRVWSRFPAEPKPRAGRSVMRVVPTAPDDDPASFVRSEDVPTPGSPNGGPT